MLNQQCSERFFGGLTEEETAEVMGVSLPMVQREWRAAKSWLHRMLTDEKPDEKNDEA